MRTITLGERTLIMGVLNVTPDSFSDGGNFLDANQAASRALEIERHGADILDIGGESTRPGSQSVSDDEQLARVLPVLRKLHGKLKIPISIDTQSAAVARAAVEAGAEVINDISALRQDAQMAAVAKSSRVPLILMHMRGEPRTMQHGPFARDVMKDIARGFREALRRARCAGLSRSQILLDPGIGFGKNYKQNFEVLARLPELAKFGCPIVIGTSRKAFIGATLGNLPPEKRIWGTAATVAASILGGAHLVRLHDVREMAQVARIADRIVAARK